MLNEGEVQGSDVTITCHRLSQILQHYPLVRYVRFISLSPTSQKLLTHPPGWFPIPPPCCLKIHQESAHTPEHILSCQTWATASSSLTTRASFCALWPVSSMPNPASLSFPPSRPRPSSWIDGFHGLQSGLGECVCGDVFASPSACQAYGEMKALPSKKGTIWIIHELLHLCLMCEMI